MSYNTEPNIFHYLLAYAISFVVIRYIYSIFYGPYE